MAQCFLRRLCSYFNAALIVQANPDAMITVTGENVFVEKADGVTGIATFYLKKKGTYTIETNSTAELDAAGNVSTIDITKSGKINAQMLKIDSMLNASAYYYANDKLAICWENAAANYSGVMLRFSTEGFPTIDSGTLLAETSGMPIQSAGSVLNGFIHEGVREGTTYYYSLFPYYDINGKRIYASKAKTINKLFTSAPQIVNITQSGTYTVPDGVRTLKLFVVGGGGGGGNGGYTVPTKSESYDGSGAAGGGGGIVLEKTLQVSPGDILEVEIGKGGAGGNGSDKLSSSTTAYEYYKGKTGSTGSRTVVTLKRGETVIETVVANGGTGGEGGNRWNTDPRPSGGTGQTTGGKPAYMSGDDSTNISSFEVGEDGQNGVEKDNQWYGSSGSGGGIGKTNGFVQNNNDGTYSCGVLTVASGTAGNNAGKGYGIAYDKHTAEHYTHLTSEKYGWGNGENGKENTGSGGGGGCGNAKGGDGGSGIVIAEYI